MSFAWIVYQLVPFTHIVSYKAETFQYLIDIEHHYIAIHSPIILLISAWTPICIARGSNYTGNNNIWASVHCFVLLRFCQLR